jgi:predicted adenylyl cyclase CyaB
MIEIEHKYRLKADQVNELANRLAQRYGDPKSLHQIDEVFLYQKDSFTDHKQGEPVVRIRQQNGQVLFTVKRAMNDAGDSAEHELGIESHATMRAALIDMGYRSVVTIDKKRRHYGGDGITYALDEVANLGMFLEIEILAEQLDNSAEEKIFEAALDLGIDTVTLEPKKYDTLLEKSRSNGHTSK